MFPVHLLSHKYANDTWEGRHFLLDSHLKIKIIFLTIELRTTPLPSKTIVSQICGWHDISSVHGNNLKRKNCGHFVATLHMYTTCRWFWQSFTYVSENMDETIQKCLTYRYMWGEARQMSWTHRYISSCSADCPFNSILVLAIPASRNILKVNLYF